MNVGNLSNSDHCAILLEINMEPEFNPSNQMVFDFSKADFEGMEVALSNTDWPELFQNKDADQCWMTFRETVQSISSHFIPQVPRRKKNKPPWMTKTVVRMHRKKQRLWRTYNTTRSEESFTAYKDHEKKTKKAIRSAKRSYEKRIAKSGDKKPFHAYINSKTKSRIPVGPLKVDERTIIDNTEMAETLNTYFCSVFTKEDGGSLPRLRDMPFQYIIGSTEFSRNKVKEKLTKIKPSSSPGPDGLSARILHKFAEYLAAPLAEIFTLSLQSGMVPSDWRSANVSPIFKKGSRSKPENHRPVSLTPIPCRIMESIIKDEITEHLEINRLINPSQHGFMSQKSCSTNLLEFLEILTEGLDEGACFDIVYLDFAKAFNKVPIKRLLLKLKAHGIGGNILQWITQWLTDRRQRTVINGKHSSWAPVLSGVPQGSVLGPLLFIIFINDIDYAVPLISTIKKFADDTKAAQKIQDQHDQTIMQQHLNNLFSWSQEWGMLFNLEKCKIMHTGRNNPGYSYTMGGTTLKTAEEEKDIGVVVHNSLKPSRQCHEAARRANQALNQISKSFHFRDRHVFIMLYKQFVRVHLEFSVPSWSPWSTADKEVLEKVQKRAIKMVSGLTSRVYEERLLELNMLTLEQRRTRYDMIETFKILRGFTNVDSSTWFTRININARHTRNNAGLLNLERREGRSALRRNFFSCRVPPTWNSIPDNVKASTTVSNFKQNYDAWIQLQLQRS